jgi:hypothetical protein
VTRLVYRLWDSPTFTTWASLLLRTGGLLLTTPLLLNRFSTEEIAVWYFVATALALQVVFEMGFTPTFVRAIAYTLGESGRIDAPRSSDQIPPPSDALERLCATMQGMYGRLALALLAVLGTVGTLAAARLVLMLESPASGWLAWGIMLVATAIAFGNAPFGIFLQGADRVVVVRRVEALTSMFSLAGVVIALLAGAGLVTVAVLTGLAPLATSAILRRRCQRESPELFRGMFGRLDEALLRELWPATWRSGLGVLMSSGLSQATALMYAQTGSAAQVASFLFSLRVLQVLVTASQAPFYTKLPRLASLHVRGALSEQIALAARGMAVSHWVYATGVIAIGLTGPSALQFAGSNALFVPAPLWFLMGAAFFVERYSAMHLQFYSVRNHIVWHVAAGATGVIYLGVWAVSIARLGPYTFPVATLVGYLGFYSWYAARHSYAAYRMAFWPFECRTSLAPALLLTGCTLASLTF